MEDKINIESEKDGGVTCHPFFNRIKQVLLQLRNNGSGLGLLYQEVVQATLISYRSSYSVNETSSKLQL